MDARPRDLRLIEAAARRRQAEQIAAYTWTRAERQRDSWAIAGPARCIQCGHEVNEENLGRYCAACRPE